jgi:phosphate-selective porin OprO and OprP
MRSRSTWWGLFALCLSATTASPAQQPAADTTRESQLEAGESDAERRPRNLIPPIQFDFGFTTLRIGGGFLVDATTFAQDDESKAQVVMEPGVKVRDFRVLLNGRLNFKRKVTWQTGLMYDGQNETWMVRQTGLMVAVPELWGNFFIGRAKEGFSLTKVMSGYDPWTMERFTFNETIPLLADGIKWLGYLPSKNVFWNLGVFADWLSEDQSFSSYDHQFAARVGWLPMFDSVGTLFHIALNYRTGKPDDGQFRVRARPENNIAPYFIDTGKFPSQSASMGGLEWFYRPGPLLFGSEYYWQQVDAPASGDPVFHGGDIFVAWLVTGETRSYNTEGGYFRPISPGKTVFEGGPGAWEAILRFSYSDLDDGSVLGGRLWRITPMVNWHLTDYTRLELVYGYSKLFRFDLEGGTQFFQSRIQIRF